MIQALQLRFQNTDWLEAMLRAVGIEEDDRVFDYLNARTEFTGTNSLRLHGRLLRIHCIDGLDISKVAFNRRCLVVDFKER